MPHESQDFLDSVAPLLSIRDSAAEQRLFDDVGDTPFRIQ
jgi:hypothetical protein